MTAAAVAWIAGDFRDDRAAAADRADAEAAADHAVFGLPERPGVPDAGSPEPFLLWPENEAAVRAFLRCATQWVWLAIPGPKGSTVVRTGLDYARARSTLQMAGIDVTPPLFDDIQQLEAAAIDEWARRRNAGSG